MSEFNGIEVFEILPNGCLNGVWSDNNPLYKNEIFNEIARKKPGKNSDLIIGKYTCSFIDFGNEVIECELEIRSNLQGGKYSFIWKWDSIVIKGTGWLTKQNQLTVWYKYNSNLFNK